MSGDAVRSPDPELTNLDPAVVAGYRNAPDLAGWRRDRVTEGFLDPEGAGIILTPDWVCEVLSPSTAHLDRKKKLPIYRREHVGHTWLVDPASRELEVFRWTPDWWLLVGAFQGDDEVRAEPSDAVPLDLAALWTL